MGPDPKQAKDQNGRIVVDREWSIEPGYARDHPAIQEVESNQKTESGGDSSLEKLGPSIWTRMGVTRESFKEAEPTTSDDGLHHNIKTRHLTMIAIGGCIGAGLFVGSGGALSKGGPAGLLLAFAIIGFMMFNVMYALGELAVLFPLTGGIYTYSTRFIDPSWGFAMGYNYALSWSVVLPLELTVAALTAGYWNQEISMAVWVTVFYALICLITLFGVIAFAEEEFWSSTLKLTTIIIFTIVAIVLVFGGGPSNGIYSEFWGARTWSDPGAFRNGFRGFCAVLVTAAFAYNGTELVSLAAAETEFPAKALPRAIKHVLWRIVLFYFVSLMLMGFLVRSNDPRLLGAQKSIVDVTASPFVIAVKDAGLIGLDSCINAVIIVSVISIGICGVYSGSRTITALADNGYAPRCFSRVDRAGRPTWSTLLFTTFGLIAYAGLSSSGADIFEWLQAVSGLAVLFTWGSVCVAHIRFRKAWVYRGHTLDEIPFKAAFGVWGSWMGLGVVILVLIGQFYNALFPVTGGLNDVKGFFKVYLAFPVVLFCWLGGYLWKRQGWLKIEDIDVDTGRRAVDWEGMRARKVAIAGYPIWKRVLIWVF